MPAAEAPIVDEFYWDRVFAAGMWHGPERWVHGSSTAETTRDFQALSNGIDCVRLPPPETQC